MRRILLVAMASALLVPAGGARAIPPAAAGALASDNIEFIANVPDIVAIGAKVVGNTMYVTTTQGLRIYDIALGIPVPIGALELPHWENEAVDTNGEILLIAADHVVGVLDVVYVIDVSIPQAPLLKSVVTVNGAHTATCIKDCQFAWTAGGDVIDLRDPANAVVVGRGPVGSHNANVDEAGIAWLGGTRAYDTNTYGPANLLEPTRVATGGPFGWHNTLRPDATKATPATLANSTIDEGELLVGTDEAGLLINGDSCQNDGPFRTSWYRTVNGTGRVDPLDIWRIGQGTLPNAKPEGIFACSSHWFDVHGDVVADAWYDQGTRFLDVSNPRDIRQVGYFMPAVTEAWMTAYNEVTEGPTAGLYVYVFDYARGLDILQFKPETNAPTVLAPRYNPSPASFATRPDPDYGWACRIVARAPDAA